MFAKNIDGDVYRCDVARRFGISALEWDLDRKLWYRFYDFVNRRYGHGT